MNKKELNDIKAQVIEAIADAMSDQGKEYITKEELYELARGMRKL